VVSTDEYARIATAYHLLPDLAISCDGPVRSVALFSHRPAEQLDGATVLVSESSRTSVYLLELLCSDVWDVKPTLVEARTEPSDIDALEALPHEAVLVIGDGALLLSSRHLYEHHYDLGEQWKTWTGLPFVFAVWAARRHGRLKENQSYIASRVQVIHEALMKSREWGLGHIEELAYEAGQRTGIDPQECMDYLGGLDYALSYSHLEGLTSFFRRLAAKGMVSNGSLSFLSVA